MQMKKTMKTYLALGFGSISVNASNSYGGK